MNTIDKKKTEYLIKTFSRTKRKDYENYVLNAIWNKLDNRNIKPITQQYVKRSDGSYALIDLYFPDLNIAIECDEEFHKDNKLKDAERELALEEKLGTLINLPTYTLYRVDASEKKESLDSQISKIVEEISKVYENMNPKPVWEIIDPVQAVRNNNNKLSISDDIRFATIYDDIYRLFGKEKGNNPQVRCTFDVSEKAFVWCPKFAIDNGDGYIPGNANWLNITSADGNTLYEKGLSDSAKKRKTEYQSSEDTRVKHTRYVFARIKDHLGNRYYKFLGVFDYKYYDEENNQAVFTRTDSELDLSTILK